MKTKTPKIETTPAPTPAYAPTTPITNRDPGVISQSGGFNLFGYSTSAAGATNPALGKKRVLIGGGGNV